MLAQQFDQLVFDTNKQAVDIVQAKRPSYTIGSEDVLANFKRVAERLGNVTPAQVLAVYMLKHIDAIVAHASKGVYDYEMSTRIADAINYLHLMNAMLKETACSNAGTTNAQ